jgi:hypothetical protein
LLLAVWGAEAQIPLAKALERVAEEAAVFQQNIPKCLTQETLTQSASMPPSRFRPSIGAQAAIVPKPRTVTHDVVSEYSVGHLKGSDSANLYEFRQVVSVDNKAIQSAESARRALTMNLKSQDEQVRKRMLEEYAKFGLVDVATDYGLVLLAFTKRGLENMELQPAGTGMIGADSATIFAWKQITETGGELEFHNRIAVRQPLVGKLWVRTRDGLPLRVEAAAEYGEGPRKIRDESSIEYIMSAHGFLTPVTVLHKHFVGGKLMTENHYRYEPFKLFAADAEIKFDTDPQPGKNGQPVIKK